MLVLTRRVGEKLVIGNEVIVEVVSVSGDGVRLGITAPRETSVHRFEVFDEIQAANRAAAASSANEQRASLENFAARLRQGKEDGDKEKGGVGSD
jgi:carbon storage regulator